MRRGALLALAGVAGVVAAVVIARRGPAIRALSAIRLRALELIGEVLPSAYPSARFARIAPSYTPAILAKYPTYSTCGELPAFVARSVGFKGKIASAGLELLRTEGTARGCWKTLKDGRPLPGDFYGLANTPGGIIVHVGVIKAADGDTWETADAGQGPLNAQRADYVSRTFDARAGTLTAGGRTKFLAGWVDIDCLAEKGTA